MSFCFAKLNDVKVAAYLDGLVAKGLKLKKKRANRSISDEVFLRRIYLDIVGRIPTPEEYDKFMADKSLGRRNRLITELFEKAGYISHSFNYWADALRATSLMPKTKGEPYLQWIKNSIAENKPYDQFVNELISAEGSYFKEGNGAAGYYLRDHQMPLDNAANTMQLFLATSMVCAQCHDHPYKKWSQMDFYKVAAFTAGTVTSVKGIDEDLEKFLKDTKGKSKGGSLSKALRPLYQGTFNSGSGEISLPEDYDYDDGEPEERIKAQVPFGAKVSIDYKSTNKAPQREFFFRKEDQNVANVNSRQYFADWITSPANPMFTKTIVNRLWKRAMGVRLAGNLIDMKESSFGPNERLTKMLILLMKKINYDQNRFLKILYMTKTYQRQSNSEIKIVSLFQGPLMTRLSAEQFRDSLVTLRNKNPDESSIPPKAIFENRLYEELVNLSDEKKVEFAEDEEALRSKINNELAEEEFYSVRVKSRRASDLYSPYRAGSLLQVFGQSQRQVIDDAFTDATIPQALMLLNGKESYFGENPYFARKLKKLATIKDKIILLYKAVLSRRPTVSEFFLMKGLGQSMDEKEQLKAIYWILLNSHEFKIKQ